MKILFLSDDNEDYLADGILHGLKSIEAIDLIDYPRKDVLYRQHKAKATQSNGVRGYGFTLYGRLNDTTWDIDRSNIKKMLENCEFNLVIISNIWRQWGLMIQWEELLIKQERIVILDGDDDPRYYPRAWTKYRRFGLFPKLNNLLRHENNYIFKREWPMGNLKADSRVKIYPISFSVPRELVRINRIDKTRKQKFQSHIVDHDMAKKLGRRDTNYVFQIEAEYHDDIWNSRFGITTKRAGWDCLRHYEIASNSAILCFKNLDQKPKNCAPHGLIINYNCISYGNPEDLLRQINQLTKEQEAEMRLRSYEWAMANTTEIRAKQLLKIVFGEI